MKNKDKLGKSLAIGIIALFLTTGLASTLNVQGVAIDDLKENSSKKMKNGIPSSELEATDRGMNLGNILYVGGSGPNNYTSIQDAINNASDGDTVFVYDDSSPYYENVVVDKSINLIGEDRNNTIIDGGGSVSVVYIFADWVNISGFTIRNSGINGISVHSNNIIINDNTINSNNYDGIDLYCSSNNTITGNNINSNNDYGIELDYSSNNTISGNTISKNGIGIFLSDSYFNVIKYNNFKKNLLEFQIYASFFLDDHYSSNSWNRNYWGRPRIFPKPILGLVGEYPNLHHWLNFDWHPLLMPHRE